MGVQIVQDHSNHRDIRIGVIHQTAHLVGKVLPGAPLCYRQMAPASAVFTSEEQVARACPLVFVVLTPRSHGLCRQWRSGFGQEPSGGLVKTDHWPLRVIGLGVEVQHVLHGRQELAAYLGHALLLFTPRLERVLFSRRRTVSWDRDSANLNSTALLGWLAWLLRHCTSSSPPRHTAAWCGTRSALPPPTTPEGEQQNDNHNDAQWGMALTNLSSPMRGKLSCF